MSKLKLKVSSRLLRKRKVRKKAFAGPKTCRFCANREQERSLDYKNINLLRSFITERGKILPSRVSGNCSFQCDRNHSQCTVSKIEAHNKYNSNYINGHTNGFDSEKFANPALNK